MTGVMEKREANGLASLQIPKDVDVRLEAYCTRRSKVKRATVTRLLERFLSSPDPLKTVLLGEEDEGLQAAYASWLEGLAKRLREEADPPEGATLDPGDPEEGKLPPGAKKPSPRRERRSNHR